MLHRAVLPVNHGAVNHGDVGYELVEPLSTPRWRVRIFNYRNEPIIELVVLPFERGNSKYACESRPYELGPMHLSISLGF